MIKKLFPLAVFFIVLPACVSSRAVINHDFDFSSVRTVRVGNFTPDAQQLHSGSVVRNAFMRQLLAGGWTVIADGEADVLIEGAVTVFQPAQRYLVRTSDFDRNHRHPVIVTNDVVEISGSRMYDLGTAFGMGERNRIMASNATVGIFAHMTDLKTGKIVWSMSHTNEGLDLQAALDGAVRVILRTLPRE